MKDIQLLREPSILRSLASLWWLLAALCGGSIPARELSAQESTELSVDIPDFEQHVQPLLHKYCVGCHGAREPAGDRRLDALLSVLSNDNQLSEVQDVLDQLNLGDMPPSDADQPTDTERQAAIASLTEATQEYYRTKQRTAPETSLRRLNAREYRNVVRDMLHLNTQMFDPTDHFPKDQTKHHLDNLGRELVTSSHLLMSYLEAAEEVVEKAAFPIDKPQPQTWRFHDGFRQQPEIDQVHGRWNRFERLILYDVVGADKHEGAYAPILAFASGVPADGTYRIRFRAQAVNREHPYDDEFFGTDRHEPFRLGVVAGNADAGPLHKPQPIEPLLAELELSDAWSEYEVELWLDRGFTPRFTFRNGLMDVRNLWTRIQRKYPELFPEKGKGIVFHRRNAITRGKMPQIHIDDIEITGPHYENWPRESQETCFGQAWEAFRDDADVPEPMLRKEWQRFLTLAYRRTATDEEVETMLRLYWTRRNSGQNACNAYVDTLKAALCSPNFLYWNSFPADANASQRRPAIASRLSAFLWSSSPDAELHQIQDWSPSVLRRQSRRMLNDPKSQAFIDGFLNSWLTLSDLGSSPPDRQAFPEYYHYELLRAMRTETHLCFQHMLQENRNVYELLDANYTFVNKRLAMHYGLQVPAEMRRNPAVFQKVSLSDRRRGGVLGHASVQTVTANGIDTSPIIRGVWILENLLGTPPPPPPPDVEPLDPDVRGAKSMREQLEKHRELSSCNACHQKIDPLGFAMESFDPVGRWRERYAGKQKIDTSGQLPDGSKFEDVVGLKRVLRNRSDLFLRALTTKLMSYALGRELSVRDRPEIERICEELEKDGGGLRTLVELVAASPLFRAP